MRLAPKPITLTRSSASTGTLEPQPFEVVGPIPGVTPVWGAFYSTTSQPLTNANQAYPVNVGLTAYSRGVAVQNSSQVVVSEKGTYNLQFSLQITSSTQQLRILHIWLRRNGVNLPYSASRCSISESNSIQVPAWNFFLQLDAGDTIELISQVDGTSVTISTEPASGNYPAIPSSILTIHQVSSDW